MTSLAIIFLLVSGPQNSLADTALKGERLFKDEDENIPWEITAKSLTYNEKEQSYIATGDVFIKKKDQTLHAQNVVYNIKTGIAEASGDVRLEAHGDVLTGQKGSFDLKKQTGKITNGCLFLKENHFYISGDVMEKVGEKSYLVSRCRVTTCDGDNPDWTITGSEVKVTIEGYGTVKHASFRVRGLPMFYMPYIIFPAKTKRQTGLLPPRLGYSDRRGAEYTQPFFWAINESSDATFYLHHMSRRGEKLGMEYRYILENNTKGTLMYDYLDDRKVDDGTPESIDWAYRDDNALRSNSNRYWFRMKNDQEMPFDFSAKLDLDIVSDQDYLHEFKDGYTGFDETEKYFVKNFGRGFDDYNDQVRINRLNLNRIWSQFSLNAEARWYDDVINRGQGESDQTLYYLPLIEFDGSKQPIFETPLYYNLDSEYRYSYKREGTKTHRADIWPRAYLPLKLKNYLSFEPSIGVRETVWRIDEFESSSEDRTLNREIYDLKGELSTYIFKVYNANFGGVKRIKNTITPKIVYSYIPDVDQDNYPERIEKENLLTYSITSTFISKSLAKNAETEDEISIYDYHEFCRLKLEQSYDINKEKGDDPEPFLPIYGEIQINPGSYFSIRADAEWTQYENNFLNHSVRANLWDNRGDKLYVEHRYNRDSIESVNTSIKTDLYLKVTNRLAAYSDYEYNFLEDEKISSTLGFVYRSQCWSIDINYTDEDNDKQYAFMINLYGLGGFGTSH
ncbi:MAG TPA: hypothetical protein DDW42_01775 [Desulfobacteraceae bacterium]|nr:hypothetical protein [Desulfobacteraceae bacterium]